MRTRMTKFTQNKIGLLEYPAKARIKLKPLIDVKTKYKLRISLAHIANSVALIGILSTYGIPHLRTLGLAIGLPVIIFGLYFLWRQYQLMAREDIAQQHSYYEWGNVTPPNNKQLEALQLIAFSRYKNGLWTDTLETEPAEIRVRHIPDFRKKLDALTINTIEQEIGLWVDDWGMSTVKKYHSLYDKLLAGLHTELLLRDLEAYPNWKDRIVELTDISEAYFDSCFNVENSKPQKFIWAWDLWRAISLTSGAYMCGFISEKEAWERIYKVSDICHYLFNNIDDFLRNMRMGHAYWCNAEKSSYERKLQVEHYLNPRKETKRLVHSAKWTKTNGVNLPENMKDSFKAVLEEYKGKKNTVGFKSNQD